MPTKVHSEPTTEGGKLDGRTAVDLQKLHDLMESKDKKNLDELGGVGTLAASLDSDIDGGLRTCTDDEINRRKQTYGKNEMERKPPPTIWELFVEAMQDTTIIILLFAAAVSIMFGIIICVVHLGSACPRQPLWKVDDSHADESGEEQNCIEWIEGVAVLAACFIVGSVTAINNYKKEQQFRKLQAKQDDLLITVWRGGNVTQVSVADVVVGDVVQLDTGSKIPADGVLIKFSDLKIDESSLTGESVPVGKNEEKPFLLSGCAVVEGDARYLVTAVGEHSEWGKILSELDTERPDTPLQIKLAVVAENVGKLGLFVAVATFIAQMIIWLVEMGNKSCFHGAGGNLTKNEKCFATESDCQTWNAVYANATWTTSYNNFNAGVELNNVINFFIDSVTIIVVAIPEGLPLAVTISLAYSVQRMQKDMNLVRVMAACETMGGATNICSDKTGTLTENMMTVAQGYFAGRFWAQIPMKSDFRDKYFDTLANAIAINSRAELGKELPNDRTEVIGNKTEGAMLMFIRKLEVDYRKVRQGADVVKMFPFSSAKKRMSALVRHSGNEGMLFTKGASEIITDLCAQYMAQDGSVLPLDENMKKDIFSNITEMAGAGLRTIGIAYSEVSNLEEVKQLEDAPSKEMTVIFLGIVGIRDPPRKEVPDAVRRCQKAGITVRMITGDNILTAKSIAKEIGIYTNGIAIEGPDFRKQSPEEQKETLKTMQVMARCSPQDKLTMVRRLKEMGEVVAVTGDGTNDAPALKEADVGLSMGITGTPVAQEASDIVIMDDNFSSIVKSVLWGRSVYDNIRRFLQFQLTVNVCALVLCLMGAITGFGTPLRPIHLLWVNLIMDTLAALALATELPTPDMLERKPYGRSDLLINGHMWRNLLIQALYQIFFCLGILYGAPHPLAFQDCILPGQYAATNSDHCITIHGDGTGHDATESYRNTIIYNAFVWAQLFNEFNARKIYNELNPFEGVMTNTIFLGVVFVSSILQFLTVQFIPKAFRTVPLDGDDWGVCLILGFVSIPLGILGRFLPPININLM